MKIRVRAKLPNKKFGFYGGERKYSGDEFSVEPENVSKTWMVVLDEPAKSKSRSKPLQKDQTAENGDGAE